jgi:hypothetical protein
VVKRTLGTDGRTSQRPQEVGVRLDMNSRTEFSVPSKQAPGGLTIIFGFSSQVFTALQTRQTSRTEALGIQHGPTTAAGTVAAPCFVRVHRGSRFLHLC